jgi:predicted dehydrogenase
VKLGFCGVGRWAQKLADAFRACGAEIVAHDRRSAGGFLRGTGGRCVSTEPENFGVRMPWRDQLADKSIDAIVAAATPEVTTEVALACAAAGKPVMATKPLFDHPATIHSVFYVDFWRLWAEHQRLARSYVSTLAARPIDITLEGSGPHRSFPGAFDYGPHVIACMLDLCGNAKPELLGASRIECAQGELFQAQYAVNLGMLGKREFALRFGNGAPEGRRSLYGAEETPLHMPGMESKDIVLQRLCQSFLSDIAEGFVSTRLLDLSRESMAELRKIREMAK